MFRTASVRSHQYRPAAGRTTHSPYVLETTEVSVRGSPLSDADSPRSGLKSYLSQGQIHRRRPTQNGTNRGYTFHTTHTVADSECGCGRPRLFPCLWVYWINCIRLRGTFTLLPKASTWQSPRSRPDLPYSPYGRLGTEAPCPVSPGQYGRDCKGWCRRRAPVL